VKYGAVLYKNNSCGDNVAASNLSNDYSKITTFIDQKTNEMNCSNVSGYQPVNEGLMAAGRLLADRPDETNIIITIGTSSSQGGNMYGVINSLPRHRQD
jgi:hypothetical protein